MNDKEAYTAWKGEKWEEGYHENPRQDAWEKACSHKQQEIDELKQVVRELRECCEFYASSWEHINHVDGIMVRKAYSYDKFEDWHERARQVLERNKEILGRVE